ncbi:MAG TPA: DUF2911 domain-containing protein [Thermoanaerobaculia bacterium]|nr:DUF2911 domain-containing protein [Thermoanaerobaculia bacterium]
MKKRALLVVLFAVCHVSVVFAQPHIRVPQASPHARVEETFGVTDVAVDYHRPSVKGRKIWGGLVPYDVIWRAGANEATQVSFSTPVTIEGQPLAAGTYALYVTAGQPQYTVTFSKFLGSWGTYGYDPSEDALKVQVTPQPAEMQERLAYEFTDAKDDSVTLALHWEKLRIPVKIAADTKSLTMTGIKNTLRGDYHWQAPAWTEAARYAFNAGDTDLALDYVNHAMSLSADGSSLRLKAAILEKKGDAAGAKALRDQAAALAPEITEIMPVYRALGAKKYDDAIAALTTYNTKHSDSYRGYALLGEAYAMKGDKAKSKEAFDKALSVAKDQAERVEVQDSINSIAADQKE